MSYVIVNVGDQKAYRKSYSITIYETERGAKIACTKLNKNHYGNTKQWIVMEEQAWVDMKPAPKMVERTNLMTGKTFMEAEDTPYFCSPSSESYWSN